MSAKQRLHELVERLPESEIETAVELLEALVEAPVDPEMLARIDAARQRRGGAKLAALQTAIDEGDASGISRGDAFERVRKTLGVRGKLQR